jgi:hypothetical protein
MGQFLPFIKNILTLEPLAKVSEKDIEKSFPGELERIGYRFLILSSFRSLLGGVFIRWAYRSPVPNLFLAIYRS